jgi:hypothetical protein
MAEPLLLSGIFTSYVYPFLLVFVLFFAILDKSKILGDGKRQINAIISLVIALMFVAFGNAVNIVTALMPFLAVAAVIILVFMILAGFIYGDKDKFELPGIMKKAGLAVVLIAVVIAVLFVTGYWEKIAGMLQSGSTATSTIIFIVIIIAALVAVLWGSKEK